jgi:ATP-dependent DNA helicase RecG
MAFSESETLELKRSTSELTEGIISIVAILNKHYKGRLCFGIKNSGEVIGQTVVEKTIRDVSKSIADHIEPKIYPKVTKEIIDGKACIMVDFEGTDTPYFAFGRAYIRVGDEDRQLSAKEIENFILKKNKSKISWDSQVCNKATLNDISSTKLRAFLKLTGYKYDTVENGLNKLKLIPDGKILNTAVILFGKKPDDFFPNAKLRCAVFGTTGTAYVIDMQDYVGDLFYLIEKAEDYILKNIHIGMRIEGMYRVDVPEIDREAFREAIINAFCHRDYYAYDSVNVAIFKDRLEIRSPGLLFGDLTIEKCSI